MDEQRLPEAELEVLACLHGLRVATARQLREAMTAYRPMAHGSMVTLLNRLRAKGLVEKQKGLTGKAFVYSATRDSRHTLRPILKRFVRRIFGGSSTALIASLFETHPPTAEELQSLEKMLADLRKESKTSKQPKRPGKPQAGKART